MATNNSDAETDKKPDQPKPANGDTVNPGVDPQSLFKVPGDVTKNRETQLLDVIKGVMSTDGMNVKTVLEDKHIVAIARGLIFAERYNSDLMRSLVQILMEVRVSKGGRGRKDLISAIKSSLSTVEELPEESAQRKRRLFGG